MHWRGGSGTGGCYDVIDNTNDQIYRPESDAPSAGQIAAVEATWTETITKNGAQFLTGYRSGSNVACGADVNGNNMFQHSARNCAAAGMTRDQILKLYYGPGVAIQIPAARPAAVFLAPGFGGQTTAGSSVAAAWAEETDGSAAVTSRNTALQMAAPINGSCSVDRWLPSTPGWSSTDASPQPVADLRTGYCYRFVTGLTDSAPTTAYSISGSVIPDPLAPVASFTSPADGTIAAFDGGLLTVTWNEILRPRHIDPQPASDAAIRLSAPRRELRRGAVAERRAEHDRLRHQLLPLPLQLLPLQGRPHRQCRSFRNLGLRRSGGTGSLIAAALPAVRGPKGVRLPCQMSRGRESSPTGGDEMGTSEQTPQGEQPEGQEPTGQSQFRDQAGKARELGERWLGQLQEMIDQAGRQAGPVLRDVAAKAAELAAVAAEHAGPVAHKAPDVTESGGRQARRPQQGSWPPICAVPPRPHAQPRPPRRPSRRSGCRRRQ